jgi:ABC-type antimicrobial peptide transport system permease subunit
MRWPWPWPAPRAGRQAAGRRKRDEDLDEEIRAHIEMSAREREERGATADEARATARREFGNVGLVKETTRDVWGWARGERLWQDVRYGLRMMRRGPGFTVVAVITLALGIGATTAIFSVVYGVLLRPLPYSHADRIVALFEINQSGGQMEFSDPDFDDVRSGNHTFEAMAKYGSGVISVTGGIEPTRSMVSAVSRDFLQAMGVQPARGRNFRAEDQRPGAAPVALVSYGYWRENLNGAADTTSFQVNVENRSYTVVGVLPPGFGFPDDTEIWVPIELDAPTTSRTSHNWKAIGRLRDGTTLAQARADVGAIASRIVAQYGTGDYSMRGAGVASLQDSITGGVRPALLILMGAAGFLLLVACANVANLFLLRTAEREHELAIRAALGASRGRLVRQFLTETLLISAVGGTLGVLAAFWGVDALLALAPKNLPRLDSVSINLPVLLFALALTLFAAIGLGLFTAMRASSGEPKSALAEGGRTQSGGIRGQRAGRAIVGAEIAITLVLLVGAGLLGRSLLRVLSIDPGFRTEQIVTMDLSAPSAETIAGMPRQVSMLNALFDRLRRMPGVEEVGGASSIPLDGGLSDGMFLVLDSQRIPAYAGAPGDMPGAYAKLMEQMKEYAKTATSSGSAEYCAASEGYFRALGIPLERGRLFDERDVMDAPHVAVVSESLARMEWPNENAIGRLIEFGNMDGDVRPLTVVGVVGDVRERALEVPPSPTIYVSYRQRPQSTDNFTVVVRTTANPDAVMTEARGILRDLDPTIAPRFRTFSRMFSDSIGSRRFSLTLAGVFAVTALLLAMAGIYGVMAYSVTRRTREIGVRMALGAERADVLKMVLGQGLTITLVGVFVGIAGSLALTRTMKSMLFGITATDPITLAAVAILLTGVALAACYIPARRATRVDPMVALRYE